MRNVLAIVPKGNAEMVAAAIRTIVAQPGAEHVGEQFEVISGDAPQNKSSRSRRYSATPKTTCSPSPASPPPTGRSSGRPSHSRG
jgi:hypothetical protein